MSCLVVSWAEKIKVYFKEWGWETVCLIETR